MRKSFLIVLLIAGCTACQQPAGDTKKIEAALDSLQRKLDSTYKPGLGEFMSGIQVHHAKLWFAGISNNWPLADFEVHEIKESLDDIKEFCSARPEVKALGMIDAPLDSLVQTISRKDNSRFRQDYIVLTNSCNKCHQSTEHGFNVVTIPSAPPVVNQDFKPVMP